SDNASRDGTEEMVQELAGRSPCSIRYDRRSRDEGLAPNLIGCVTLSRGRYCWLLGSDDLLAVGALARACELVQEVPNATGYVVGALHVDARNPELRSRALAHAFFPPHDRMTSIEGLDRIYSECGNAWCALSWSIVQREAFVRAAKRQATLLRSHPIFPQVLILAAMAAERPLWAWLPEPLVRQRNATTFLFEQAETTLADRWADIIGAAAAAWAAVLGRSRATRWRRRMRGLHEV